MTETPRPAFEWPEEVTTRALAAAYRSPDHVAALTAWITPTSL